MTEILDVIANIVLLPYHIMKAFLMFLLANIIIVIVLVVIVVVTLIILVAIFPTFFLKALLGVVFYTVGVVVMGLGIIVPPLALVTLPIITIAVIAGSVLYLVKSFSLLRLGVALIIGPLTGAFLLGWAIGEFIEDSMRKPDFNAFAQQVQGTLTAYDGKGNSERHRAAIAIKPGSKYYGLALSMTEKDDINKTDSGKFWVTQEIPNTIFLFQPAYDNLNISAFYQ